MKNFLSIYLPEFGFYFLNRFLYSSLIRGNCFLTAHMLKIRKTSVALWAVSWVPIRARVSNIISYLLLYGTWVTNVSKEIMISIYNSTTARPTDLFFFFFSLLSISASRLRRPLLCSKGENIVKNFFFTIINNTFFISTVYLITVYYKILSNIHVLTKRYVTKIRSLESWENKTRRFSPREASICVIKAKRNGSMSSNWKPRRLGKVWSGDISRRIPNIWRKWWTTSVCGWALLYGGTRERDRDRTDVNLKFPQHVLFQSALDSFFLITSTLQGNLIAG